MNELEAATTDELVAELFRRYTSVLIVAEKASPNDDDHSDTFLNYCGGKTTAIGLAQRSLFTMSYDSMMENADDD